MLGPFFKKSVYKSLNLGTFTGHLLTNAKMSPPHLPPETIENIIDHLHDDRETLESFCLVSKLFVPRTRKYLFEVITIGFKELQKWQKTFPDPKKSPTHHTRFLDFRLEFITTEVSESGLIQSFTNIVRLMVCNLSNLHSCYRMNPNTSLVPFHNFSLIKSLCVVYVVLHPLQIIKLICSLPLLEDLCIGDNVIMMRRISMGGGTPLKLQPHLHWLGPLQSRNLHQIASLAYYWLCRVAYTFIKLCG